MKKNSGMSISQFFRYKQEVEQKLPLFKDTEILYPNEENQTFGLQELIKNTASTFILKVKGDSMIDAKIENGDLLIVDRSLQPSEKNVVIVFINDVCLVRRVRQRYKKFYFDSDNEKIPPIEIKEDMSFHIFGVVTHVIHSLVQ